MSQLDTYLLGMVSFQIIKEREVQLAVTAPHTGLGKKGGEEWVRGIKNERNALCSPAAHSKSNCTRVFKTALCSLPLLIIAPLSALCSGWLVPSATHSCVVTVFHTLLCFLHFFLTNEGMFCLFLTRQSHNVAYV